MVENSLSADTFGSASLTSNWVRVRIEIRGFENVEMASFLKKCDARDTDAASFNVNRVKALGTGTNDFKIGFLRCSLHV